MQLQLAWHHGILCTCSLFKETHGHLHLFSTLSSARRAYQLCRALNHPRATSCDYDGLLGPGEGCGAQWPRMGNHWCVNCDRAAPAVTLVPEESEGQWPQRGRCLCLVFSTFVDHMSTKNVEDTHKHRRIEIKCCGSSLWIHNLLKAL